jgi:hypothetical protein
VGGRRVSAVARYVVRGPIVWTRMVAYVWLVLFMSFAGIFGFVVRPRSVVDVGDAVWIELRWVV